MAFNDLISEEQAILARKMGVSQVSDYYYCHGKLYMSHHANALIMGDPVYRTGWTAAHTMRDQTFIRWLQYVNETGSPE